MVEEFAAKLDNDGTNHATQSNGQKNQPRLLQGKAIDGSEDVEKGAEEIEEDAEDEGHIEAKETHNGLGEHHVKWSKKPYGQELSKYSAKGCALWWLQAQLLHPAALDDGMVGFASYQNEYQAEDGEKDYGILSPSPAHFVNDEDAKDGTINVISFSRRSG